MDWSYSPSFLLSLTEVDHYTVSYIVIFLCFIPIFILDVSLYAVISIVNFLCFMRQFLLAFFFGVLQNVFIKSYDVVSYCFPPLK